MQDGVILEIYYRRWDESLVFVFLNVHVLSDSTFIFIYNFGTVSRMKAF
jgi:hypothetical protein